MRHVYAALGLDAAMVAAELFLYNALARSHGDLVFTLLLPAYLLYSLGLFARAGDRRYLAGLAWLVGKSPFWGVALCVLQTLLGALAFGSFQELLGSSQGSGVMTAAQVAALILLFPLSLAAMIRLVLAARKPLPGGEPTRLAAALSHLGLWAMGLVLMAFLHRLAVQATFPFGPTIPGLLGSVLFTGLLGLLFYFPARFHYILEAPRDRGNWASFGAALILYALFLVRGRS